MVEGVAEYRENGTPERLLILENAIKDMDPTFEGRPVYVEHVDQVDVKNLQRDSDGYVVKSFFNQSDGKHWCEFLITSEKGLSAIKQGWKLSNAYRPVTDRKNSRGDEWHGVPYQSEVLSGAYDHLAIVSNPRYTESIILTPEEFRSYNDTKLEQLKVLQNSKEKEDANMSKFKLPTLFKKEAVKNAADLKLEELSLTLPESKKEMTVSEALEVADKALVQNMSGYANGDHMVKVGEDEMSVNDLVSKFCEMKKNMDATDSDVEVENEEDGVKEEKKGAGVENAEEDEKKEDKKENESEEEKEKKKNAADKKAKDKDAFEKITNAHKVKLNEESETVDLAQDKVARGKNRYGSDKK